MKVRDMMSAKVESIDCGSTLSDSLGRMKSGEVHELVVTRGGRFAGILSYDHILKRMNMPLSAKVENLLTLPPRLHPDDSIVSAAETLLSAGLRAAPVTTKDDKVLGIISRTDIIKIIPGLEDLSAQSVGSVMSHKPICVAESDSINRAKGLIKGLDEKTIPVVDTSGKLAGILDIADIGEVIWSRQARQGRGFESRNKKTEISVKSLMRQPVSVPIGTDIRGAISQMMSNDLDSVVVTANEKPVGILTQGDLIELVARRREQDSVFVQITGLSDGDPHVYDSMYSLIERSMKRIAKTFRPQMLLVHVSQYNPDGKVSKYSIRARLSTQRKMYFTQTVEWDVMKATDLVMRELEKMVLKDKDILVDRKKQQGERRPLTRNDLRRNRHHRR